MGVMQMRQTRQMQIDEDACIRNWTDELTSREHHSLYTATRWERKRESVRTRMRASARESEREQEGKKILRPIFMWLILTQQNSHNKRICYINHYTPYTFNVVVEIEIVWRFDGRAPMEFSKRQPSTIDYSKWLRSWLWAFLQIFFQ